MKPPITITMMELRSRPGEWIYYKVFRQARTLNIRNNGKIIAQISPIEPLVIEPDGDIHGSVMKEPTP